MRIPESEQPLALRTDFSNDAAWRAIKEEISDGAGAFFAGVDFLELVDDPRWSEAPKEAILKLLPRGYPHRLIVLVDKRACAESGHPLLIVKLGWFPFRRGKREMRAIAKEVGLIAANLSTSNMDWNEFAGSADPDGVFRGFPER